MPSGVPDWEVPGCANPLLLQFVGEMLAEAKERNTKGVTTYNRAYNSLKAQTISYTHPCELKQLVGYGDGICNKLIDRLKKYCEENELPMPQKQRGKKKPSAAADDNDDNDAASPVKKPKKVKPYAPKPRTGPYALLLALGSLDEDAPEGLTKTETIELAQEHCDSSFLVPSDPGGFYTAWRSMNTLVDKDLVQEKPRPTKRYRLTDDGWDCYRRLKSAIDVTENGTIDKYVGNNAKNNDEASDDDDSHALFTKKPTSIAGKPNDVKTTDKTGKRDIDEDGKVDDIVPEGQKITDESSLPTFSPITIQPWQFTVEFVLDNREIKSTKDRDYMQNEFIKKDIRPIMRTMELGDALWVAKCKDPQLLPRLGLEGDEIMLDYIVERKRLDDLVSSIKDNRFHEQKFRLKRSGVKNIIYLVEEMKLTDVSVTRSGEMMQSAMASTQVVDGFFLKKTQKMDDTIRYLERMTKLLKNMYEHKTLLIIPTKRLTAKNYTPLIQSLARKQPGQDFHITYEAFGSLASKSKSMTLRDYYLKMLMCTRGITGEKAVGIQKIWKTPIEFVEAFEACGNDGDLSKKRKREMVSSKMGGFNGRKKVAASLSAKVAENWAGVPPAK